jgi:cation diffusion facilitator CzcD-associated flavoprotein CzcO
MQTQHVDVLIVGAGVSGVGMACHLARDCKDKSYLVLERRHSMGGTWDLFRYPGIRSDSDMLTFSYNFRPWNGTKVLADGPSIRAYVEETAAEYGVTERTRFGRSVVRAEWSTPAQRWTVDAINDDTGETETYTADFVVSAAGYYDYDEPYRPEFPGEDRFAGPVIHPQHWPEELDYRGKRVVVIGSGATAVTLVPALADDGARVTMLQRSPSYIMSLPSHDAVSEAMRKVLPARAVYRISRARNILLQRALYTVARSRPKLIRRALLADARRRLGPDFDLRHFKPKYSPWDQRLCVVPDGDLFRVLRDGTAEIVTDEIETFTENGITLASGRELPADIVVAATGLRVRITGGNEIFVDGEALRPQDKVTYKSVMIEGVPNCGLIFGYTNASWTLKADIAAEFICRVINRMDAGGYTEVVANAKDTDRSDDSVLGALSAGYVLRAKDALPRQGTGKPWVVLNNYLRDAAMLRYGPVEDGILSFRRVPTVSTEPETLEAVTGA